MGAFIITIGLALVAYLMFGDFRHSMEFEARCLEDEDLAMCASRGDQFAKVCQAEKARRRALVARLTK